jgi:UDP-N-acetylmuramyl tripeptide synthase
LELEVCLSEEDAVAKAVSTAQPGDFIAVFYEEYEPLKNMIMAKHHGKAVRV